MTHGSHLCMPNYQSRLYGVIHKLTISSGRPAKTAFFNLSLLTHTHIYESCITQCISLHSTGYWGACIHVMSCKHTIGILPLQSTTLTHLAEHWLQIRLPFYKLPKIPLSSPIQALHNATYRHCIMLSLHLKEVAKSGLNKWRSFAFITPS